MAAPILTSAARVSIGLALLGVALLYWFPGHPIDYIPAENNWIHSVSDPSEPDALFVFTENQEESLRLIKAGNDALERGDARQAIDLFRDAQRLYSFAPGAWEGLTAAYTATGELDLAADARLASQLRGADRLVAPSGRYSSLIPEVKDVSKELGLGECSHRLKENESVDLASPGVAVADLDQDRRLDIICLRGPLQPTLVLRGGTAGFAPAGNTGLEWQAATQGVYVADVNEDGRPDVFITAIGENRLYVNEGGMRFRKAPLSFPPIWGSAAAFADFTGDGHLDLALGGWFGREIWQNFDEHGKIPTIKTSTPLASHNPETPYHLLNIRVNIGEKVFLLAGDGAGNFRDVTAHSGIDITATNLNLEFIDVNADGNLDLFVINDSTPNRLFLGQGGGRFVDVTEPAKLLDVRAGMGLAVADFDGAGGWDFVITHFQGEMNAFYFDRHARGTTPEYADRAMEAGIGVPGLPYVGWATFAWDFNADGWEDLLVWNGHMREAKHPPELYLNKNGKFLDLSQTLPRAWAEPLRARGAALVDLNGDGFDDLVIAQANGPLKVLQTKPTHGREWLRVRLALPDEDARGGVLEVVDEKGQRQRRPVRSGSAFFSSQPQEFFFGLGDAKLASLSWTGRKHKVRCADIRAGMITTVDSKGCSLQEVTAKENLAETR